MTDDVVVWEGTALDVTGNTGRLGCKDTLACAFEHSVHIP